MTKYFSKFLLVFMLCLTILGSMVATAQAQTTVPGVTPTPTSLVSVLPLTGDQIAFSQLITSDITLTGPFDSNSFLFALPASWRLTAGPRLDLHMAISFNAPPANIAQNSPGEGRYSHVANEWGSYLPAFLIPSGGSSPILPNSNRGHEINTN